MSTVSTAVKIIPEQPQAKRLRAADLPTVVARGVQLVGVDAPPTSLSKAEKTIDVVELRQRRRPPRSSPSTSSNACMPWARA